MESLEKAIFQKFAGNSKYNIKDREKTANKLIKFLIKDYSRSCILKITYTENFIYIDYGENKSLGRDLHFALLMLLTDLIFTNEDIKKIKTILIED